MTAPVVDDTTGRLYRSLPELYRTSDATANPSGDWAYPLLRYLAGIGSQLHDVAVLVDRLDTDLGDPVAADVDWMPWLAQRAGVDQRGFDHGELRFAVDTRRFDPGSLRSVRATVEGLLGGDKRYSIIKHAGGDIWHVVISAHPVDAGATTWTTWLVDYPTWAEFEQKPTWESLEDTAPLAERSALEAVRPAGVTFEVVLTDTEAGGA